jgi:acyl carrier protein
MTPTELRAIIVEEIGNLAPEADAASVDGDADLREALDLDSMDIFNLVVALSKRLEVDIPDADVGQLVTIGGGVSYLARAGGQIAHGRERPGDEI